MKKLLKKGNLGINSDNYTSQTSLFNILKIEKKYIFEIQLKT